MKIGKLIAKIAVALAAIAGVVYVVATYGEQIVAWCKKVLASLPCKCGCNCECECEEGECTCECACEAAEEPAEEAVEEVVEEVVEEEAPAAEEVVAEESDFAE
jgi:hypothetical protein